MSILFCTPAYGGQVTLPFFNSAMNLAEDLRGAGIEYDWLTFANESLIQRARNSMVARFLETEFRKLMFIDADIEFSSDDVARLWNLDADVAAGIYPMKKPGAGYAAWVGGKLVSKLDFNEPVEADYAGTGFMMIDRAVFEKLREKFPERKYEEGKVGESFAWFDPRVKDGVYLSEDYAFCEDWRAIGGKILVDPSVRLIHHGTFGYGRS